MVTQIEDIGWGDVDLGRSGLYSSCQSKVLVAFCGQYRSGDG
jgi:hypothetical protein